MNTNSNFVKFSVNPQNIECIYVKFVFSRELSRLKSVKHRNLVRIQKNQKLERISVLLKDTDKIIDNVKLKQIVDILNE